MHENVFKHLDIQWWLFQEQNEEVRGGGRNQRVCFHFISKACMVNTLLKKFVYFSIHHYLGSIEVSRSILDFVIYTFIKKAYLVFSLTGT